jgi:RNA polymerase sigma factor (sigma-70 family)
LCPDCSAKGKICRRRNESDFNGETTITLDFLVIEQKKLQISVQPLQIAPVIECVLSKLMNYQSTHESLVAACIQGNRRAQSELYGLYNKAMYNTILRMVPNRSDAEDLLQSSFVEVFMRMESFRGESTIGAWIKRIVINKTINFLKSKRLQWTELDEKYNFIPIDAEDSGSDPMETSYTVERIKTAVSTLPEGYRMVFSLYAFEGYDHEEIAEIMQINEATSKSQYSRAKAKLRSLLTEA